MSEMIISASASCPMCPDGSGCLAEPETDGDWQYYVGSECGSTFGFVRVAAADPSGGACSMGVAPARRATLASGSGFPPGGVAAEVEGQRVWIGHIGRRPE